MGRFRKMLYKISTNIKVFLFVVLFTFVSTVSHAVDLSKNYETVAKSVFIVHTLETYKPVLEGKFSVDVAKLLEPIVAMQIMTKADVADIPAKINLYDYIEKTRSIN